MNLISHPWNIVFLLGFVVYLGIRHVFERRTRGNKKKSSRIDGFRRHHHTPARTPAAAAVFLCQYELNPRIRINSVSLHAKGIGPFPPAR